MFLVVEVVFFDDEVVEFVEAALLADLITGIVLLLKLMMIESNGR